MRITIVPESWSYRTHGVKAAGQWADVSKKIDLALFRKGEPITVEVERNFDNRPVIVAIIPKETEQK